jgi:hypothetical protein
MKAELVYLLLFAATVSSALACFAGVVALERLPSRFRMHLGIGVSLVYLAVLVVQPGSPWFVSSLLVMMVAVAMGRMIGRGFSSRGAILTFLIVVAVVDLLSFSGGLTRWIIEGYRTGESQLLYYLSISVPLRGRPVPVVGIGDLVIVSGLFRGLRTLSFSTPEVVGILLLGLTVALGVGLAHGGIAALPFISASVAGYLLLRRDRPPPVLQGQTC